MASESMFVTMYFSFRCNVSRQHPYRLSSAFCVFNSSSAVFGFFHATFHTPLEQLQIFNWHQSQWVKGFLTKYFNDFVLQGTVCDALIWKYQAVSKLNTICCVSSLDLKNADNKICYLPLKKQANNSIEENTSQHDVPDTADGWRQKFRIKLIDNKFGYLVF